MALRVAIGICVGLLTGCSETSANLAEAPNDPDDAEPVATSPPTDGTSTDADTGLEGPGADWYGLELRFEIGGATDEVASSWVLDRTALSVDLRATDDSLLCTHGVAVLTVAEAPVPDIGPALVGWWALETDVGASNAPCPPWPARSWYVGLGPYDPRLDPMLAERGMLGLELYGLYLQEEVGGPVYVIGVAGTTPMLSGEAGLVVEAGPLADGVYQAESLVLMTVP